MEHLRAGESSGRRGDRQSCRGRRIQAGAAGTVSARRVRVVIVRGEHARHGHATTSASSKGTISAHRVRVVIVRREHARREDASASASSKGTVSAHRVRVVIGRRDRPTIETRRRHWTSGGGYVRTTCVSECTAAVETAGTSHHRPTENLHSTPSLTVNVHL